MSGKQIFYPEFLDFMVGCGALLFGDFTLKSGRKSPYFINAGKYNTGAQLAKLGKFYTKLIQNSVRTPENAGDIGEILTGETLSEINRSIADKFDVLFGPAYKGIPLATATAAELSLNGLELKLSFDRKERKDHGEGDLIMGYYPKAGDKIAIIEDVTTAGTSVREVVGLLRELKIDANVAALYISVDRMERGTGDITAIEQLERDHGIKVYAIATANDIINYLEDTPPTCAPIPDSKRHAANIREYLKTYGVLR